MIKKKIKKFPDIEAINGLIGLAEMMCTYRNSLIENGMSEQDALKMTIAYQGQQMESAFKANVEEKKMMMSLKNQSNVIN